MTSTVDDVTCLSNFSQTRRGAQPNIFDGLLNPQIEALRQSYEHCSSSEVSEMPGYRRTRRFASGYIFDHQLIASESRIVPNTEEPQTFKMISVIRKTPRQFSLTDPRPVPRIGGLRAGSLFSEPAARKRSRRGSNDTILSGGSTKRNPETFSRASRSSSRRNALGNIFIDVYRNNGWQP